MGSRKIMDLGAPTLDADATTKKYVDTEIAKALKPYKEFMDTFMKNKGENYGKLKIIKTNKQKWLWRDCWYNNSRYFA